MADNQPDPKQPDPKQSDPRTLGAICSECADQAGAEWQEGHLATFWMGKCGICHVQKSVTSPSDFLWPTLGKYRLSPEEVD